jgi:diacylglycerol kinase (ATP)
MRAAAILGLNCEERDLEPFRRAVAAEWSIGLPAAESKPDAILVFGGDGTIHRHLKPLVELDVPVLVVPRGSGNDFARSLEIRKAKDSLQAWRKFVSRQRANVRRIDLGVISPLDASCLPSRLEILPPPQGHARFFCCVGGAGLDGEVARRANALPRWLRARGGYLLSLPGAVFRYRPARMDLLLPNGDQFSLRASQPSLLIAFANGPWYGAGMHVAPGADMADGRLDVLVVEQVSRPRLALLFPQVYAGRHLGRKEIQHLQAERFRVVTERPLDVYADGEYVCRTPIEVSVAPRALPVIVP